MEAFSSVGVIAAGNTSAAISGVERSLAASIPLALGFLGQVLHLGNIGGRVKGIIGKLRGKLERVQEKVMKRVAALIDKVLGKGKVGGKDRKADQKKQSGLSQKEHDAKVKAGLLDLSRIEGSFLKEGKLFEEGARKTAFTVKSKHTIFKDVRVLKYSEEGVVYEWFASHGTVNATHTPPIVQLVPSAIKNEFWASNEGRPRWTPKTRQDLADKTPDLHVKDAQGQPTKAIEGDHDRRHMHAFDAMIETAIRELNGRTYESAQKHLQSKGFGPRKAEINEIKGKLKKFLAVEFNKTQNLWVGPKSENSSIGAKMADAKRKMEAIDPATHPKEYDKALKKYAQYATDLAKGVKGGKDYRAEIDAGLADFRTVRARFSIWNANSLIKEGRMMKTNANHSPSREFRAAEGDLDVLRDIRVRLSKYSKECRKQDINKINNTLKGIMMYEHKLVLSLYP